MKYKRRDTIIFPPALKLYIIFHHTLWSTIQFIATPLERALRHRLTGECLFQDKTSASLYRRHIVTAAYNDFKERGDFIYLLSALSWVICIFDTFPSTVTVFPIRSDAYEIGAGSESSPPYLPSCRHLHGQSWLMLVISQHTKAPLTNLPLIQHTQWCLYGKPPHGPVSQQKKEKGIGEEKKEKLNVTKQVLEKQNKNIAAFVLPQLSTRGHCSHIVNLLHSVTAFVKSLFLSCPLTQNWWTLFIDLFTFIFIIKLLYWKLIL